MKMTQTARRFIGRHPLSLREIIATPMIFRENVPGFETLPFPTAALMRDLASFAGHGYGAFRTAMSRAQTGGELASFVDERGITRYRLSEVQRSVSDVVRGWSSRPAGFLIAVFTFRAEEEAERRLMRETLKYFGFKRIAQNTYINGMIDTAGLEATLSRAGVADHFYAFRCPVIDDPGLLERLRRIFDVEGRARVLTGFLDELRGFLEEPGIDGMELGRRVFYAGPAHHRVTFVEEPPLPPDLCPPAYPLAAVRRYLADIIAARAAEIIGYYRTRCG